MYYSKKLKYNNNIVIIKQTLNKWYNKTSQIMGFLFMDILATKSTFEIRNLLMIMVGDNETAYGIAHEFVADNEHKLTVYQRCWNTSQAGDASSKASAAKDKAVQLWVSYSA